MVKKSQPDLLEQPLEVAAPGRSFYVPHARVQYTGEVVDPVTGVVTKPPSRTKQSFLAECDINNILKQFKATGIVTHINAQRAQGRYEDLPASTDFQEALNTVMAAEAAFASLPSLVRERFGNDPERFLAFVGDPKNADELVKLGLTKPVPAKPGPVEVVIAPGSPARSEPGAGATGGNPPAGGVVTPPSRSP